MPQIGHRHACRGAGPPISGRLSPWVHWLQWGKPGGVAQGRPLIGARNGPGVLRQSEPPILGRIERPAQRSAAFPLWARFILIRIFFSTTVVFDLFLFVAASCSVWLRSASRTHLSPASGLRDDLHPPLRRTFASTCPADLRVVKQKGPCHSVWPPLSTAFLEGMPSKHVRESGEEAARSAAMVQCVSSLVIWW